ncbi:MAG TPA: choice-of-anchor D domain-containing protein, partial [Segetibacter sp.]
AVTVSNSAFSSNSATYGGGIYVARGTTNVSACDFTSNTALSTGGGGICNIATLNVSGSRFITNSAGIGGGLWNATTGAGGAIGNATVNTSVFDNNRAFSAGGGVNNHGDLTMSKCFLFRNLAQSSNGLSGTGGGFHQGSLNTATSTFTNCVIANNAANGTSDRGGGGGSTFNGIVNLTNCTLSENTTTSTSNPGNGISIRNVGTPPVVNLRNTIVWGAAARQIDNTEGTINYTTSLVKGETTNCPNVKTSDPLFVNSADPDGADNIFATADDGLMITPNSPAKNAGTTIIPPADDVTGTSRPQGTPGPQGSAYDIGAYETTAGGTGVYEINVQGNNTTIVDGDNTPSTTDSTVFATTNPNESSTRTYTIQNFGTDNLTINGISITGTDATMFVAGALTPSGPIAPNGSATFTVTFTPTSTGFKTAIINIANSDCDESGYDFAISTASPAPVITSSGGGDFGNENIEENTTAVVTVVASGSSNTYSISGGVDQNKFTINSTTGALSFITAPDFENPTDFGRDNIYVVTVKASDATGSDEQSIAVSIRNVNEAPSITSNGGGSTSTVSVPENTTAVTTVTATDADAGTTMKYSKSGGADSSKFTIDSLSGALRFTTAPDFENPTDADRNNTYFVVVRARDGTNTDDQTMTVTVTDVSESSLPANLVNVKAYQKGTAIQVEWTSVTEINVDKYEVEKSTDGQSFAPLGTVQARGNSTRHVNYSLPDHAAQSGSNYYRIKSIDKNGTVQYSSVVRVNVEKGNGAITIYPNPVTTNTISLQLNNLERGKYTVTLTNKLGQQLYSSVIEHNGGSSTQTLRITGSFPQGSYQLQMIGDDVRMTKQLIKQ